MEKLIFNDKEEAALVCEKCGDKKLKKVMSTFGFEVHGFNAANSYSKKKG
jgi:predicted nucleic acid-binding Zn ribbon protein